MTPPDEPFQLTSSNNTKTHRFGLRQSRTYLIFIHISISLKSLILSLEDALLQNMHIFLVAFFITFATNWLSCSLREATKKIPMGGGGGGSRD